MNNPNLAELLQASSDPALAEVGGSHNQKGIEFQRHWAVLRMFELEASGEKDFLFLFEVVQDVAVLDSETAPVSICLYQVKKKDRKEWTWGDLTGLHQPTPPPTKSKSKVASSGKKKPKPLSDIQNSPLGKLYRSVLAFKQLKSSGKFLSNSGCDLPLADGTNVATSLSSALAALSPSHLDLLSKGLETMHAAGEKILDLSRLHLEKTSIPATEPGKHLVGAIHEFLEKRSPRHAGQARSLAESLLAKVGPLGARTEHCSNFDDVRKRHGYSRSEFVSALGELESVPDVAANLEIWLQELARDGMGAMDVMAIRTAAASIYRRQVMGAVSHEEQLLIDACDPWLDTAPVTGVLALLTAGYMGLGPSHASLKKHEVMAHLAIRAIKKCVDPT